MNESFDPRVHAHIGGVVGFDKDNARAEMPRLANRRAGLHAEGLCLVAGGNAAGGLNPQRRHHPHRPTPQARLQLLFHRGEKTVKVDKKVTQSHDK